MVRRRERPSFRRRLHFGRFRQWIHDRVESIRKTVLKRYYEELRLKKAITFRLKETEETIRKSIVYIRSEKRRKALMEIYFITKAVRHNIERSLANREVSLLQYGLDVIKEKFAKVVDYARMTFHGMRKDEDSLTKELGRMYMTNLHPDDHHFTMNAIRLTDLTMQFLKDMKADFYVAYQADLQDMVSVWTRVCNILLMLAEFLMELMRRKGRREHVRNKSKGHYGVIRYDEPIHTVIDVNRVPVDEQPLNSLLGNTYTLCRDKARSLGRPELANRIRTVGIYVIPERRSKLSRRRMLLENPTLSYYYRFRNYRYFKPKEG